MSSGAARRNRSDVTGMTSCSLNPKRKSTWLRSGRLAIASWAAVIGVGDHAAAAGRGNERAAGSGGSRIGGEPIRAIVSLPHQQIFFYEAGGWILRARVSSGQRGREPPAGVFSIIEKQA